MAAESLANALASLLGRDRVLDDPAAREAYSRDATPLFKGLPEVIVTPHSTSEVAEVVKFARSTKTPIIARGAGSNLCAATVPLRGGIVVSMMQMKKILEVSRNEMLAVVQPGVSTQQLDEEVSKVGLMYVPDPGSKTVSTIGGNVATSAGGLRGLKYGTTKNYILGLEAVLGTGEIIRTGGRLVKDVAGYDITRLLIGSEGTLAIFTEITTVLSPRPQSSQYGVAYFNNLADASVAVDSIVAAGILPATLEFLDNTCIKAVEDFANLGLDTNAGALLLFGDDGAQESVAKSVAAMAEISQSARGVRAVTLAPDVAAAEALLYARRCSLPALARLGSMSILEDISVPRPKLSKAADAIEAIGAKHSLLIGTFGHAGDGNLHPTIVINKDDSDEVKRAEKSLSDIFTLAIDLGGTITGEHGVGSAKLPYLQAKLGDVSLALHRNIKSVFDPDGVLNPGRLGS